MSSASELSEIFSELQNLPEDLQKSITSKFAKLSGLKQLTGETAIQRDSARLDARQRAYYKKMGMPLPDDGEMITNILADNITIGEDPVIAKRNVQDVTAPAAAEKQPAPKEPTPAQPPPVVIKPQPASPISWKTLLAGALLAAGSGGMGAGLHYWLRPAPNPPAVNPGGSSFDFETHPPPWLTPEE